LLPQLPADEAALPPGLIRLITDLEAIDKPEINLNKLNSKKAVRLSQMALLSHAPLEWSKGPGQ
jgi:hypothetical protein